MDQSKTSSPLLLDEYARKRGVCFLGETGTGVSHALTSLMKNDIDAGKRVLLVDPYGNLAQRLHEMESETEIWHVGAKEDPFFINLFDGGADSDSFQVAEDIIDLMYMLFDPQHSGIVGPRFEHAIRNTVVALIDAQQGSFMNMVKMLTDTEFLASIIPSIKHESVRIYFTDQLEKTSDFHKSEVLDYIVSKLSVFVEPTSFIGNMLNGSEKKSFVHLITNSSKTVGIDLSELRKQPAHLQSIANRLLSKQLSHLIKCGHENLKNTVLYIDEANRFDHQHLDEVMTYSRQQKMEFIYTVRSISLATSEAEYSYLAGKTLVVYRVAPPDAKALEKYFEGFRKSSEIASQSNFHFLARIRTAEGIHFLES